MQRLRALQDGAYEYLQNEIIKGAFEENVIYSLNAISEQMNMSKTPVRDAMRRLEQDGLIDILPSRGFVVHTPSEDEILDLYQTRCAIEGFCCRKIAQMCACGKGDNVVAQLRRSLEAQRAHIESNCSAKDFLVLDEEFHTIIVGAVNNRSFNVLINNLYGRITRFRYNSIVLNGRPELTLKEHTAIVDALAQGEEASYIALKKHIDTPLSSNLEVINRKTNK